MTIHQEQTVGEIAAQAPAATRVFEDHGIDFCCGGGRPLAGVCREKQLDPQAVLNEIEQAAASADPETAGRDWSREQLQPLIAHILDRHHTYLRQELPRLESWMHAVRRAHGERDGAMLAELDAVFHSLKDELITHMRQEEVVLFPAIERAEAGIDQPIQNLEHEHDDAGRALADLRRLTSGFQPPPHACATYRALYAGLESLEKDLHVHIHLENNILFPRAIADAQRSRGC